MKRFHAHISVDDLATSITFYNKLFAQTPSLVEQDYAKWMLDDPRINFAISTRGHATGLNHFGLQADTETELTALKLQAESAMGYKMSEASTKTCCYSLSKKYWVTDPSGIPWEQYISMNERKTFNDPVTQQDGSVSDKSSECCMLSPENNAIVQPKGSCC